MSVGGKVGERVGEALKERGSKKGSWRDNISDVIKRYSPDEIVSRPLPANLVARPIVFVKQTTETITEVLSAPPLKRPGQAISSVKRGLSERLDFNKTWIKNILEMVKR
jgi:hypothetical protein